MNLKSYLFALMILTLASCSIPVDALPPPTALSTATPQLTLISPSTFTPIPALTQPLTAAVTIQETPQSFCDDPQAKELIKSFSTAVGAKDGQLLASIVSPTKGIDVRYYRDGKIVNYDAAHAKFVFETSFEADWGLSFGSGAPTIGSFQEIILPSLQKVFIPNAVIKCNEIKTGGATYLPEWPYSDMNFMSVYFPGTDGYGGLDWQTWAVGMDNVSGKLYLAALVHYVWEP